MRSVEIAPRRGLDAVEAVAPFGDVEIDLHIRALLQTLPRTSANRISSLCAMAERAGHRNRFFGGLHGDGGGASVGPLAALKTSQSESHSTPSLSQNLASSEAMTVATASAQCLQRHINALIALAFDFAGEHQRRNRRRKT